jgi:hypothetical protein
VTKVASGLNGVGRHLIDHSFLSGTSRILLQNDYYETNEDFDLSELMDAKFFILVAVVYLLWIAVMSLVNSIFTGSFIHAFADIYAGNTPTVNKSISYAKTKMWSVYCFQVLYALAVTGLLFLTIGIPVLLNIPDFDHPGSLFLGIFVGSIAVILFTSGMVGGCASIVIEGKSSTEAFGRSWELCKNYLCFIFCTIFCINFIMVVLGAVANNIFDHLPGFLALTGHIIVNLINMVIGPMINFVIYMSIRIQKENTTQEELNYAIGTDTINGVEMAESLDEKGGSKGPYTHVVAEVI